MTRFVTRSTARPMLCALLFMACAVGFSRKAQAILVDRGPDMVYDTVLDITWARNAALGGNNQFLTWQDANAWVDGLTLGGFDDWRLPLISASGGTFPIGASASIAIGCAVGGPGSAAELACRDDEMAYMYYYNFQNSVGGALEPGAFDPGNQTARGGEQILNVRSAAYWSGTAYSDTLAWQFNFAFGLQSGYYEMQPKNLSSAAWAVRDGDVLTAVAVPEPTTLALLAAGVGALLFRRTKSGFKPMRDDLRG